MKKRKISTVPVTNSGSPPATRAGIEISVIDPPPCAHPGQHAECQRERDQQYRGQARRVCRYRQAGWPSVAEISRDPAGPRQQQRQTGRNRHAASRQAMSDNAAARMVQAEFGSRDCALAPAAALRPRTTTAAFPGSTLVARKIRIDAISKVTMAAPMRLSRNCKTGCRTAAAGRLSLVAAPVGGGAVESPYH